MKASGVSRAPHASPQSRRRRIQVRSYLPCADPPRAHRPSPPQSPQTGRAAAGRGRAVLGHDLPPFVTRSELFVVPGRQRIVQPAVGNPVPLQQRRHLGRGHAAEEVFDQRRQRIAVFLPGVLGTEQRIGRHLRPVKHLRAKRHPFAFVLQSKDDRSVLGPVRAVRSDRRMPRWRARRRGTGISVAQHRIGHPLAEGIDHGDLHVGPLPSAGPPQQPP